MSGGDRIWAPWRISYILGPKPAGCIFCAVGDEEPCAASQLLARWPNSLVMLNRYPYTNGHLMVVPRRHASDPAELPAAEFAEAGELCRQAAGVLRTAQKCHGLNLGMNVGTAGGAGIETHLHWHLVPRYAGDNNFMPVVADARVVNQSLEATWEALRPALAALVPPPGPETWRG